MPPPHASPSHGTCHFLSHLAEFSARSWCWDGSETASCSDHTQVEWTRPFSTCPEIRHLHQIPSELHCHLETALPTWQREQSAPPHSSCLDTCPCTRAQKSLLTLAGKNILNLLRHSLCPAHSTKAESIAIGTVPSVRCTSLFVMFVTCFGSLSQVLLVIAKSRRANLI